MKVTKNFPIDRDSLARTREIAEEIKFCMMTSSTPEGHLISRPMTVLEVDEEGCFWFFASEESEQTVSLDIDDSVNLAFALPSDSKYLAVSGSGMMVKDRGKIDALWNPWAAAWFPDGKDDPLLCLIRVQAQSAEYWEAPAKATQLFGIAKAILTHTRYDTGGEHAKLI